MTKSIVSYGVYLPFLRITRDEYISSLGKCAAQIKEKTVMDTDEDVTTMAVAAGKRATATIDKSEIGVLVLASTNFPYQEKLTAGTVVQALSLSNNMLTSQHSGSTMAGSEAFLTAAGLLEQSDQKYALVIIADAPTTDPADDFDHGLGAAACAFVLAKDEPGVELEAVNAYVDEAMGLRYRLPGEADIRDIGVKTYANQIYTGAVKAAVSGLLSKLGRSTEHYNYVALHQNDIKTASAAAKRLGFSEEQTNKGITYDQVGDSGACSAFLGLCAALDDIKVGDKALICSYGSGAGSQALSFNCTKAVSGTAFATANKKYIDYIQYLKIRKKL